MKTRSASGESRRPTVAPSWPPITEPTAISATTVQSTWATTMKITPAMPLTKPARTFLRPFSRCIESSMPIPRTPMMITPWAAPK
jgi:hypothetical protein